MILSSSWKGIENNLTYLWVVLKKLRPCPVEDGGCMLTTSTHVRLVPSNQWIIKLPETSACFLITQLIRKMFMSGSHILWLTPLMLTLKALAWKPPGSLGFWTLAAHSPCCPAINIVLSFPTTQSQLFGFVEYQVSGLEFNLFGNIYSYKTTKQNSVDSLDQKYSQCVQQQKQVNYKEVLLKKKKWTKFINRHLTKSKC